MNIYVDACWTGVGIVIGDEKIYYPIYGQTTNQAEYLGIILALYHCAAKGLCGVTICSDSEVAVHQINGRYRAKSKNLHYLAAITSTMLRSLDATITHIHGKTNPADGLSRGK